MTAEQLEKGQELFDKIGELKRELSNFRDCYDAPVNQKRLCGITFDKGSHIFYPEKNNKLFKDAIYKVVYELYTEQLEELETEFKNL